MKGSKPDSNRTKAHNNYNNYNKFDELTAVIKVTNIMSIIDKELVIDAGLFLLQNNDVKEEIETVKGKQNTLLLGDCFVTSGMMMLMMMSLQLLFF